jgi:hypothetical protein
MLSVLAAQISVGPKSVLSRKRIMTEVYTTKHESLYIWAMRYECHRIWQDDVTKMSKQMSARQVWALENIVHVGTQGKSNCRGNVKNEKTKMVSKLLYQVQVYVVALHLQHWVYAIEAFVVFVTGGPGVFLGHPWPYLSKTIPKGSGVGNLQPWAWGLVGFPHSRGYCGVQDFVSQGHRDMDKKWNVSFLYQQYVTEMSEQMSARQVQALENIVHVGTRGKSNC